MSDAEYRCRIDALAQNWARWAELGTGLSEQQWAAPTRCVGWDVAALYAHVGLFPQAVLHAPVAPTDAAPVTAADILRGFNAPAGVAYVLADQVREGAVATATVLDRRSLVDMFAQAGPVGIAALRERACDGLVPWPAAGAVTTWAEGTRIVLMESVVHLLDVLDGLGRPADVPGLHETVQLLAELADPVAFVEAATGRSAVSPLPVLR